MSAINFVVRDVAGNISRGSVAGEGVSSSLVVGAGADVSLNLNSGQILSYTRQGQALEITLIDGRVITIEGYFTTEGVAENELFLSADGYLTEVDLQQGAGADYFANYIQDDGVGKFAVNDDLYFMRGADVQLADAFVPADDAVGMLGAFAALPLLGLGGAGVAAAGAAAVIAGSGGGGGGGDGIPAPDVVVTDGTVEAGDEVINAEDRDDGVEIGGTGTPGAVVDVTVNGTTETATIDENGEWTVTFDPADIDEGEYETPVEVTVTNDGGSTTVTQTLVVDTVIGVEADATGGADGVINAEEFGDGVTLTGTIEGTGGNAVVVTIGGADFDATVNDDGTWSLDVPTEVLGEGEFTEEVIVTATDAAGNSSSTTATIVVDTVIGVDAAATGGADDVINAAEFGSGVTLSGTVEGTGGNAVVVTIGGVDFNATVAGDGSWTLDVPTGALGEGEFTETVTVTATDAAGNSSSTTSTIVVDTVIGVDVNPTGGADGVINASEFGSGVSLSGSIEGTGGNAVVVTIGGVDFNATVNGSSWSLDVPTSVLGDGEYTETVTVTATDAAGNSSSTTASIVVDTVTSVTVDTTSVGGADNVVNGAEHPGGVTLTGTAQPGATVVVTLGTVSQTVTATAGGTWSTTYAASDVPTGELDLPVNVTATDAAGNTASATGSVTVDTFVNELEIDTNSAGGADGVVNFDESGQSISLTGTVEPGSTVSVNLGGVVQAASVDAAGNWSVTFPGGTLQQGEFETNVTVTATDAAGNTSSLSEPVIVDTVAGDLALSTQPIEIDDVVNAVEASDGVVINGTATAGLTVTVGLGDATLTTVAAPNGTWSVTFPPNLVPADTDSAAITASITDAAGNFREVSDTVAIDTVVEPHEFSAIPVEGDNIINAAEAANGVVLSGTTEPGSSVVVEFGGESVTVISSASGAWSANFSAATVAADFEGNATATATATDPAGNVSVITNTVEIDTFVNELTTTDPVEGDNVVNASEAADGVTLGGTVEAGSTVSVTFAALGGLVTQDALVDANGNWTVTFDADVIPAGQYDANITINATDANGNTDSITDTFTVDTVAPDAAAIESVTVTPSGVTATAIDAPDEFVTINEITASQTTNELATEDDGIFIGQNSGGTSDVDLFPFDAPLPNGSHLVVNESDSAGNSNATFVVLEETGTDVVDLGGLDGFNIGSIELGFAQDAELTLDLATLEGLSDDNNNLIIHGSDADADQVTILGATNTGTSEVVGQSTFDLYTLGDDAEILIEQGITVIN